MNNHLQSFLGPEKSALAEKVVAVDTSRRARFKRALLVIMGTVIVLAVLLYVFVGMLFSGSTTKDPHSQSGEVVVVPSQYGLENLGGILNFSLSPDGQWLFLTGTSDLGSGSYEYILHNIKTGEGVIIPDEQQIVPDTPFEDASPLLHPGCWDSDSKKITLIGGDANTLFSLTVNSSPLAWQARKNAGDLYDYYYDCPTRNAPFEVSTVVDIKQVTAKSVEISTVKKPQRMLATHKAGALTVSRASVMNTTVSPDGRYMAYTFEQYRGSFVAPAQGYVLNFEGEPKLKFLGAPIYEPLQWSPDSMHIYALSKDVAGQRLYRWQVQSGPSMATWKIPPTPEEVILNEERIVTGRVIENIQGCDTSGECSLRVQTEKGEMNVVYYYGEWPKCINQIAADVAKTIKAGSRIRVFGRIIADVNIHTCPSKNFYIMKEE